MYKIKVGLFNPKEGTPSFCMLHKTMMKVFPSSEQTQLDSSTGLLVARHEDFFNDFLAIRAESISSWELCHHLEVLFWHPVGRDVERLPLTEAPGIEPIVIEETIAAHIGSRSKIGDVAVNNRIFWYLYGLVVCTAPAQKALLSWA